MAEVTVPSFAIHAGYAFYQGPSPGGPFHCHAAFQIAIAVKGEVVMEDSAGTVHRGPVLIVPPMVQHRLRPMTALITYYVEPHCAFADRLRARCGPGITAAPELRGLTERDLRDAGARPSSGLDGRLVAAMTALADHQVPMTELAAQVGLSPQRLRSLARSQLGMPLARWRIWQRLTRAADALGAGQSPAQAAVTGGFADQAHFTRQLREMMGLTPAAVLPVLRPSVAARHVDRD